jgi:hypothetical protein
MPSEALRVYWKSSSTHLGVREGSKSFQAKGEGHGIEKPVFQE